VQLFSCGDRSKASLAHTTKVQPRVSERIEFREGQPYFQRPLFHNCWKSFTPVERADHPVKRIVEFNLLNFVA